MQKPKKKRVDGRSNSQINHTDQITLESTMELANSETTEPNNNSTIVTEDGSSANLTEVHFISELTEPIVEFTGKCNSRTASETVEMSDDPANKIIDISLDLRKSEAIELNNNSTLMPEDAPAASRMEIDTMSETVILVPETNIITRRRGRSAGKGLTIRSETGEMNNNPGYESNDTSSTTRVNIMETPKISKPRAKVTRKPRGRAAKKLIESTTTVVNDNPICEIANIPLDSRVEIDPNMTGTVEPNKNLSSERMLVSPEPIEINNNPPCVITDSSLGSELISDSISNITKRKTSRKRKARTETTNKLIKSDVMEINNIPESDYIDTTPSAIQVQTDLLSKSKTRGRQRRKICNSNDKPMEINTIPKCEDKHVPIETINAQTKRNSKTRKPRIEGIYKERAKILVELIKSQKVQKRVSCFVSDPEDTPSETSTPSKAVSTKTIPVIKRRNRTKRRVPKNIEKSIKIMETNNSTNGNGLDIPPKSGLQITDSVQETLTRKDEQNTDSVTRSARVSNDHTGKIIDSSPLINKYLLLDEMYQPKIVLQNIAYSEKLSPKQREMLFGNNKSQTCVSPKNSTHISPSNQSVKEITTVYEITASSGPEKRSDAQIKGGLSVKAGRYEHSNSGKCEGQSKKKIIKKAKDLSRKRWPKICTSKLLDLLTNRESAIKTDVLPSKQGSSLEIPLDLSIRNASKSTSNDSEFSKSPDISIGGSGCETKKHQSRDTTVQNIGFGSSTFNVTDLSTSFSEIHDNVDIVDGANNSGISKNYDICESPKLPESKLQNETMTFYKAPQLHDEVLSTTVTPSKYPTKQASGISESSPLTYKQVSIKVSIPAKHYFRKVSGKDKKVDKVIIQKRTTPRKTQLTQTDRQSSTNVKSSETQTSIEANRNEIGSIMPGQHVCKLDSLDSCFPGTSKKSDNDVITSVPTLPKSTVKQSVSNNKSLPKILTDELFPKGTITFSSVNSNCKSKMCLSEMGDERCSNNVNEFESTQEVHELTVHKQSSFTSVVNISQSQTADRGISGLDNNTVDNLGEFENLETQLYSCSRAVQQDETSSANFGEKTQIEITDQNSIVNDQRFDSTQLWEICPELATYFGTNDLINNNNDDKLSNTGPQMTTKTNGNNKSVEKFSSPIKMKINTGNKTVQASNDARTTNNVDKVIEDVVVGKFYYNEMEKQSLEGVAAEFNSTQGSVILADLTTANLRNFTKMSNQNDKDGLNWSVETYQYYLSHAEIEKRDDKLVQDVRGVETSYYRTESVITGSQENFHPAESRHRKRQWIEDKKDITLKSTGEKRLKLNRNRWSNDGQDLGTICHSAMNNSVESISSHNSVTSNALESKRLVKNINCEELNVAVRKTKQEPSISEEREKSVQHECVEKIQDIDRKMANCTETHNAEKIDIATTIPGDAILDVEPETSKRDFGNDLPQDEFCITSQQNDQTDHCNGGVDKNGNLTSRSTSSSSSSSSSSSQSSKSIDDNRSTQPKNLDEQNRVKADMAEPTEKQCLIKKDGVVELDDDCISLFAESIFTNLDQATNFMDDINLSPLFDSPKESDENYQDMTDVGVYFEKNIQECNDAYEMCVQQDEEKMVCDTSNIVLNTNFNKDRWNRIPASESACSPAITCQMSKLSDATNFKDRFQAKRTPKLFSTYVVELFKWHCFPKLRNGVCKRGECRYYHYLNPNLQHLEQKHPRLVDEVFDFAIYNNYNYFTRYIYSQVVMQVDFLSIMKLFSKLLNAGLMEDYLIKCTIEAVVKVGLTLRDFVSNIASWLNENFDAHAERILRVVGHTIEPGNYWNTFRDLLIRIKPTNLVIDTVIRECIYTNKDKSHITDVYVNYLTTLTNEQVSNININLKGQLDSLLEETNLMPRAEPSRQLPSSFANANPDKTCEMNVTQNYEEEQSVIPTILSPDNELYSCENSSQFFYSSKQMCQKSSSQATVVVQSSVKNQDTGSDSIISNNHCFNQWRGSAVQVNSLINHEFPSNSDARTSDPSVLNPSSSSYKLHKIDGLESPQSEYRDRHWKFHLAMKGLKQALKHAEYDYALNILNEYSDMDKTIYTTTCYRMLCKKVTASAQHVTNMIKLSVRMGVNNFLSETLFTLGMYMMIELCNANAWILAYSLFKSLQNYGFTENIAAFALISAEVCLGNRRPLKAFIILKQNNMLCTNRSKWHVISDPKDEHVRVMIITLLLDVLCQEYPDRAFYIFTYLLRDQTRIYYPIDLTAYTDKLVLGILSRTCKDLIPDVAKLMIKSNFTLKNSVFRSLVVNLFQYDVRLCRQLYRYGTWLGVYPIVKLKFPLHILIKTNWKREEMYLVVIDFLEKLSMDIGHAVDSIGPNHFTIHLVFELAPFEKQLPVNNIEICNKDELKMSKEIMKTVLQEQFNPPIRTIKAERERFMKLQNRSVLDYLKSMNVQE